MQFFPAALQDLADHFARLPGIGGKTAQRLAFHVLELPMDEAQSFADAIMEAKRAVHTCPCCQNITDRELCPICDDPTRDQDTICVVAEPKDVIAMERSREYRGVYHVLHGVISPLNHVTQDDIRVRELLQRSFRPEFLNRLDEIVFYKPLSKESVTKIVDLQIDRLNSRLADQQLKVELTPAAKASIVEAAYDPRYGARPLRRYIQHTLETKLSQSLLRGEFVPGQTIHVDSVNGELVFGK